jgi:hypothetical protein
MPFPISPSLRQAGTTAGALLLLALALALALALVGV